MLGGIGIQEIVIILIVGLLVFGATRLPKIARSLGQGIKEFKKTVKDLEEDDDENKVKYVDQGPNYAQTQPYGQYQGQQYAQYQQPGQSYGPQGPVAPQQGAPVPPGQQQQTAQPTQTQFTAPQTPAPQTPAQETGASQSQATGHSGADEKSST